jgi:predicted AlkP superfamily pyrophosphatase or phosphodiesterase
MTIALALFLALAQQSKPAPPPRLIVLVSIDQMIPEQLQRLEPHLAGGFGRFLRDGAVFWRATIDYAGTETGPGHATLATGRYPRRHGIVGNMLPDRVRGAMIYCVGDLGAKSVSARGIETEGRSCSPANLFGPALGDLLEERLPGSKCVALAGKDRSAVLMGGQHPDATLWWHGTVGGFSSSTWYGESLPEFARVWNKLWLDRARGWKWENVLPAGVERLGTSADDMPGEASHARALPRTLASEEAALAQQIPGTPLADHFALELATLAVDALELGADEATDLLAIGLSACDYVGHGHGPYSVEVTDLLLRDDRELGRLFAHLDAEVGQGRWLAVLSADHGVLELPESLQRELVGARRVAPLEVEELRTTVNDALAETYEEGLDVGLRYAELGFSFDEAKARALSIEPAALRAAIAEAARTVPWIEDAYTKEQLDADGGDPWLVLFQRSQHPERGPDVALRPEPWLLFDFPEGTSHGSPYPYDRRVPLAFLGAGIRPQRRFDAASPTDVVPTLLAHLGLALPADLDGRVLALD